MAMINLTVPETGLRLMKISTEIKGSRVCELSVILTSFIFSTIMPKAVFCGLYLSQPVWLSSIVLLVSILARWNTKVVSYTTGLQH